MAQDKYFITKGERGVEMDWTKTKLQTSRENNKSCTPCPVPRAGHIENFLSLSQEMLNEQGILSLSSPKGLGNHPYSHADGNLDGLSLRLAALTDSPCSWHFLLSRVCIILQLYTHSFMHHSQAHTAGLPGFL